MPELFHGPPWSHGPDEHQERAHRVGAVAGDEVVRRLDVAARLAHPLVIGPEDLALVAERRERLVEGEQAESRRAFTKKRK